MPYEGELASKASHHDLVRNPDIRAFLASCEYLREPSDTEAEEMRSRFSTPPSTATVPLPKHVLAIDGSLYETTIDDHLPSTKVGFVKVSSVLIKMVDYGALVVDDGRFVDPFRVAKLQNNSEPLAFVLPSANIIQRGQGSVRDSFRAALDAQLYGERTRFVASDPKTSLRSTLFTLAARRGGQAGGSADELTLHTCPTCGDGPVHVRDVPETQTCQFCSAPVYPSDCLRVWEEVNEFQSNGEALGRFMLQVEHMLPIHYMRFLRQQSLALLDGLSFFVDGPLAVFGNAAWLHASILSTIDEINAELARRGRAGVLLIGLQKTGQLADHLQVIDRFLPKNVIYPVADDYRYTYVVASREPSSNGFGSETYYGQDFLYKTPSGRSFVFGIPYPISHKTLWGSQFGVMKADLTRYPLLPRALALINHFECELYDNAVVPVALAHRHAAISLQPGGKVLDIMTRAALP